MTKEYRQCVGIVVVKNKKVLLCERNDVKGAWQFPQGGVEKGEDFIDAGLRELKEETSISSVEVISTIDKALSYDFPLSFTSNIARNYKGQALKWILVRFTGHDDEINLKTKEQEFESYAWVDIDEALKKIVEFKKQVYLDVVNKFKPKVEA